MNNSKQLFTHEHNAGSGKSHSMINLINRLIEVEQADLDVLIAVPTVDLQNQYHAQLQNALVLNKATCLVAGYSSVTNYIIANQDKIQNTRIVIITHACLIVNGNMFGLRCLVIDELPTGLIKLNHLKTPKHDSILFEDVINRPNVKLQVIIDEYYKQNSDEYSKGKVNLLKCKVNNEYFAYKKDEPLVGGFDYFHYLFHVNPTMFDNFEHIHLMSANAMGSVAVGYFTKLCGYELANIHPSRLNIRGNAMEQKVTIIPLLKFENRDFISNESMMENFDKMLDVVKANSEKGIIIAVNNYNKKTIEADDHFELISAKSHGINKYSDRTQAALIYSANPNPHDIAFMNLCSELLGFDQDFLVDAFVFENMMDVAYQSVTRTAIRNPLYTGELNFFVSDMRCAKFLSTKFPNATIDESLAINVEVDTGGAPVGNTNKLGKTGGGCPVVAALVKAGATNNKAARLIAAFTNSNGKPNELEPKHMVLLLSALKYKRLPKDFSFKLKY
ncbi:DEAD/DEAH box helicase family protein [Shewanella oncorhynchi]|uniref:DEAD/DEAH box helicase family protein n=1 Tax=Shewanella oncorhynchi TaxID=2726434 RepID=UPI00374682BE